MSETTLHLDRVATPDEAATLIGTPVATNLTPTASSPTDGNHTRILDRDTGDTIALITRLTPELRTQLRRTLTTLKYGEGVLRYAQTTPTNGTTFGYAPAKPAALQEGCRATTLKRDNPEAETTLEDVATHCSHQYRQLHPTQYAADDALITNNIHNDWRLGETTQWSSGVINVQNTLPYHRDGNNLNTWSAMPTLRYGMSGGHLHLPEYNLIFPCNDGDITWFYGKGLVHGVTPMHRRKKNAYRYSVVFYALQGMRNCASYAEETAQVAARRTARERAMADEIRQQQALTPETP